MFMAAATVQGAYELRAEQVGEGHHGGKPEQQGLSAALCQHGGSHADDKRQALKYLHLPFQSVAG